MKKALALVLALVLALSMAVSAFALEVVVLKEAAKAPATLIDISDADYQLTEKTEDGKKFLVDAEGGVFYVTLDGTKEYKNIEVTANGIVDAKLVKYDPEAMEGAVVEYFVEDKDGNRMTLADVAEGTKKDKFVEKYETLVSYDLKVAPYDIEDVDAEKVAEYLAENDIDSYEDLTKDDWKKITGKTVNRVDSVTPNYVILDEDATSYAYNKDLAKLLNDQHKTGRYVVSTENNKYVYVIELTVAENYSAAYKTGSVKVTADEIIEKDAKGRPIVTEAVSGTISIVSDVAIFEYEMVKWAASKATNALYVNEDAGYSDYITSLDGYSKADEEYNEDALRYDEEATVVSTTAFRAIAEKDLVVVANDYVEVTLKEIAAGQKGVNFANYIEVEWEDDDKDEEYDKYDEDLTAIELGFYGDQVIKGKFEIAVDLGIDYYELRELFGLKVEEEDIITYYVLDENDAVVKTIKVDYMVDDIDKDVEFTIAGENKALGQYSIVLEVPAVETETEANPNTGAESVVGVVAALAVVSVATAAAVSLKK